MDLLNKLLGKKSEATGQEVQKPRRAEWASKNLQLPPWTKVSDTKFEKASVHLEVDSDAAYAYWLALLGVTSLDQYWLEVAYQCIKLDVQAAIAGTAHDPRTAERHVAITYTRSEKYAQAGYPKGRGVEAASKGREARDHYIRLRGSLPM